MAGKEREERVIYRGYVIRYRGDRKACWQVYLGKREGRRSFRHFDTLAKARAHVDEVEVRSERIGVGAKTLSDAALRDAVAALTRLSSKATLTEAADYFMRHEFPSGVILTVNELVERYVKSMEKQNRRPAAVEGFKKRAGMFARTFGAEAIHRVKRPQIETWLDAGGWHGLNRRHYVSVVKAMFNHAVEHELLEASPATRIELPAVEGTEPEIMSPEAVRLLLHTAETVAPQIVPALAVSFFAGVRPDELSKLLWSDIKLGSAEPVVHVGARIAKKRHRRNVDIHANLAAWLGRYRRTEGRVSLTLSNHRRHLAKVIERCKVKVPYNGGRHAFASYALVEHGLDDTVRWLGHSDSALLLDTYKGTVTREAARAYWQIVPAEQERSGVIRFAASA